MQIFLSSHTILIIFYSNKHFFVKNTFFLSFSTRYFLTIPFYSWQNIFFTIFIWHQKIFFEENEYFFNFLFFIQNKISSYFEKERMKNPLFCIFSKNSKHIFGKSKRIFSNTNDVIKFINTKKENFFFNFSLKKSHNTRVSILLSTCKKNMRIEVSFHVS